MRITRYSKYENVTKRYACCLTKYKLEDHFFLRYTTAEQNGSSETPSCYTKYRTHVLLYTQTHQGVCKQDGDDNAVGFSASTVWPLGNTVHQLGLCLSTKHVIHPELCRIRTWCTSPSEMLCWRQVSVGTAVSDFMSYILSISFPATWHQPASLARLLFRLSSSAGRHVGQVGQVGWSKHAVMFSSVCYNLIDFSYIWRTVSMSFHYSVCMRLSDLIAS